MSASSYPRSAGGACKIEYKRHKSFMNSDKKEEKDGDSKDPLPIVELKPFVKKVWRRENSLPGYYDRFSPSKPNPIIRKHKENETRRENRSPDPSPDRLEMVIGNLNTDMHASRKKSGSDSPRSRQHLHPKSETIAQKQIEHSQSLVPGFITRVERTKTTLMEIHDEEAPSRINCGLKQSLDRKVIDHPPVIDLKSDKFPNSPSKKSIQYANSFRGYYQRSNGIVRSAFNGISEEKASSVFCYKV
ncbi:hypothetical protein FSP39_009456 [Pinctada imbricata]|uniref:Uncharacterized protein n=1 Tax=Pinctada imbricata TaxID=66713 RepID=A0AA88YDP1_PINIB|nr:hypothetical protein FSP39_009456 [Pinctada imbricata]